MQFKSKGILLINQEELVLYSLLVQSAGKIFCCSGEHHPFILLKPSANSMRLTDGLEDNLVDLRSTDLNVNLLQTVIENS